jgi:hypothetical protein
LSSSLITFKPQSESPERGFPLEELRRLIRRLNSGKAVEGKWRYRAMHAPLHSRAFLLVQGKLGPAIIGYGVITGVRETNRAGQPVVKIKFEKIVDPSTEVLAGRDTLLTIEGGDPFWRTQFSGIVLDDDVAAKLEDLIVGKTRRQADALDDNDDPDTPDRVNAIVTRYARDPEIRKRVKLRANGQCEFCGERGFISTKGTPYLECHHIIALANDGADRMTNVIALCPKDHREAHFGERAEELERQMIRKVEIIEGRQ